MGMPFRLQCPRDWSSPRYSLGSRSPPPRVTYGDLHQRLLEEYAPPSLLVNEAYDLLHLSAHVGRYLQFVGGDISNNVLDVVRSALRTPLRQALIQAVERHTMVETARSRSTSTRTKKP